MFELLQSVGSPVILSLLGIHTFEEKWQSHSQNNTLNYHIQNYIARPKVEMTRTQADSRLWYQQ